MEFMLHRAGLTTRHDIADWGRHIYREFNSEADALANRHCYIAKFKIPVFRCNYFRLFFDGSVASSGCGGGWILYGNYGIVTGAPEEWFEIASLSFRMGPQATVTACELEACLWGVMFTTALLEDEGAATINLKEWRPLTVDNFTTLKLANLL